MVTGKHAATLLREGSVIVPFSLREAPAIIAGLRKFVATTPENDRGRWTFDVRGVSPADEKNYEPDDGYIRKDGSPKPDGSRYEDRKSAFHWRPRLEGLLGSRGIGLNGHGSWFTACASFHARCSALLARMTLALGEELGRKDIEVLAGASPEENVIRAQIYDRYDPEQDISLKDPSRPQGLIGKPHVDKSFLTIHASESHPGLRVGTERELYRAQPGTVLVFPGQKLQAVTSGRITGLPHDIVSRYVPEGEERWSIVFFSHPL